MLGDSWILCDEAVHSIHLFEVYCAPNSCNMSLVRICALLQCFVCAFFLQWPTNVATHLKRTGIKHLNAILGLQHNGCVLSLIR
ncbi:hypothetical protein PR048_012969 [Dryococelus australis]|uniref:Uncharacterized protein n=1 Tax=Dryococelus australis TaxID=614101 RepID=A0ABQ9HQT8_9NEOP|nr:hypothetical protein PR048_012969 [Dryococelus australis]